MQLGEIFLIEAKNTHTYFMYFFRTLFILLFFCTSLLSESYTVRWGLALPLSGPLARAGEDIRRGIEMAFSEVTGEIKHKLFFEDTQNQNKNAVTAAQKLISVDKVDVIVGLWETAEPIAPLADRYNIVHASIRWNSDIADQFKNTFTFEATYDDYAKSYVNLFESMGIKTLSILNSDLVGWNLSLKSFLEYSELAKFKILSVQTYLPDEKDFKVYAYKALKGDPDIILVNDTAESLELVTRKIRELKNKQRVTGYLGLPINLELFENESYIGLLETDSDFEDKFFKTYKTPVYLRAQLAYDLAITVKNAYKNFPTKPTTEDVVKKIKASKKRLGASGPLIPTNNGKVFRTKCVAMQIKNGKRVKYEG